MMVCSWEPLGYARTGIVRKLSCGKLDCGRESASCLGPMRQRSRVLLTVFYDNRCEETRTMLLLKELRARDVRTGLW